MALSEIQKHLFEIRSGPDFLEFQKRLIPSFDPELIIGVRTPAVRSFAKELRRNGGYKEFIRKLPHRYYEEYLLHVLILCDEKDFDTAISETERILPYVNNWAVCDQFTPKAFRKHTEELLPYIKKWLSSDAEYTIRFGIEMLMSFYLDDLFEPDYLEMVVNADRTDLKYVSLMTSWYFATALAKQYDAALKVIEDKRLEKSTHNKAIQKAVESFRITDVQKAYLKSLKI